MVVGRIGNKQRIAESIYRHFPEHTIYLEPFFGAGGMFFKKPKSKYSIVNDLDSDVFNLFMVVRDRKDELIEMMKIIPFSEELFYYWKENKEDEDIRKAVRFIYLSNYSFMGKSDTFLLLHNLGGAKHRTIKSIKHCNFLLENVMVRNKCFREFFKGIREGKANVPNSHRFIYADPPYLGTVDNYSNSFTKNDSSDLFEILVNTGIRFAISEFDNPFILNQASNHGLNIIEIGSRLNLANRRNEILITNYKTPQLKLF